MQLSSVLIGGNAHQLVEHPEKIGIIIEAALIGNGIQGGIGADHFLGQHHPAIEDIIIHAAVGVFHKFVGEVGGADVELLGQIRNFQWLGVVGIDVSEHFLHDAVGNNGAGQRFGMVNDAANAADDALSQGIALKPGHGGGFLLHLLQLADQGEAFPGFFPCELKAVEPTGRVGAEKLVQVNLAAAQHIQCFQRDVQIRPFIPQ